MNLRMIRLIASIVNRVPPERMEQHQLIETRSSIPYRENDTSHYRNRRRR